jgi:hypothetical protein
VIDTLTRKFSFLVRNVCAKKGYSCQNMWLVFAKDEPGVNQPHDGDDEWAMSNY